MVIEYIEKRASGRGVGETVHRVRTDGQSLRFEIVKDGEVDSEGTVPGAVMARLQSELRRLEDVPLFIEGEPPVEADPLCRRHKLVVENGGASFCFVWRGAPPQEWLPLLGVVRTVIEVSRGEASA